VKPICGEKLLHHDILRENRLLFERLWSDADRVLRETLKKERRLKHAD
jgi:hypothetical protein